MKIVIIGDYNPNYPPHPATTESLMHASYDKRPDIKIDWLATDSFGDDIASTLHTYDAVWLGPAPYANKPNVHKAVQYVRENNIPFLGTCGGLMHSIIEFGRNVLNLPESIFETSVENQSDQMFLMDTCCGAHGFKVINFKTIDGTKVRQIYNQEQCEEDSNCSFSINQHYHSDLEKNGMLIGGCDETEEAKVFELTTNKFFILTKYLPQMRSSYHEAHPLIEAFLKAAQD